MTDARHMPAVRHNGYWISSAMRRGADCRSSERATAGQPPIGRLMGALHGRCAAQVAASVDGVAVHARVPIRSPYYQLRMCALRRAAGLGVTQTKFYLNNTPHEGSQGPLQAVVLPAHARHSVLGASCCSASEVQSCSVLRLSANVRRTNGDGRGGQESIAVSRF